MKSPQIVSDGIVDFTGGMDSHLSPSLLRKNQYSVAVNCRLRTGKSGISVREGYREINISFSSTKDEEIYRSSEIQGCGSYEFEGKHFHLVSCSGTVFELEQESKFSFKAKRLLFNIFPNARTVHFINVPEGILINDGISKPIYAQKRSFRRTTSNEIGSGHGGVYIQNRLFYIKENRREIGVSSFNNPVSTEEPRLINYTGFTSPDDTEITAIGHQRHINKDSNGGSLIFSTKKNIYSVDVSGPLSQWGSNGLGQVSGDIYDVSAPSQNSFLALNGNVFFRSSKYDLVSLQYLQYAFANQDITEAQSYGGRLFFENDTKEFINSCHSQRYNNRIFTTISPSLCENCVYWNGLIIANPNQKGIITYESIYTGIRPWCMHEYNDTLFIHSFDYDCRNRMYVLDPSINYDLNINSKPKEIESKLITREFNFDNGIIQKTSNFQIYSVSEMSRNLRVEIYSKPDNEKSFERIFDTTHISTSYLVSKLKGNIEPTEPGFRTNIPFSEKRTLPFVKKQDMIVFRGPFNLDSVIRQAELKSSETVTHRQESPEEKREKPRKLSNVRFFTYKTKQ